MKVNGVNVFEKYGIRQWNVGMGHGSVKSNSSWQPGCPAPLLLNSESGMKKIKVSVMVNGDGRAEIWEKAGRFIALFLEPVTLELDGFRHFFKVVLDNATQVEGSMNRFHKATLELSGYEFGSLETIRVPEQDYGKTITVTNKGTLESPLAIYVLNEMGRTGHLTVSRMVCDTSGPTPIAHTSQIMKVNVDGCVETAFDAANGTIKKRRTFAVPQTNGTAEMVEIWNAPLIGPGDTELVIASNLPSSEAEITYHPMFY